MSGEDNISGRINHFGIALKAIRDKEGDNRGIAGQIDCPRCGKANQLHYTIAKINGHVWGRCETKNCLSWMM